MSSSKNPSSLFFWNDLENDVELRTCSLAAKGLWACHLLPMAKRSLVPGVIVIGNHPSRWDRDLPALLAHTVGETPEAVSALLEELVRSGAASVDDSGRIFNRRMVREAKVSAERSRAGHQGALATNASRQTGRQNSGKRVGKANGKTVGKDLGKQSGKTPATESEVSTDSESIIRDEASEDVRQISGKGSSSIDGNTPGKSSASSLFSPNGDPMRDKPLQGLSPEEPPSPVATRESAAGAPHARPSVQSRLQALVEARRERDAGA